VASLLPGRVPRVGSQHNPGAPRRAIAQEMLYLAVSMAHSCEYCIASHGAAARKKGMTEEMFGELMAVVGMASETNRLVTGWRVPLDETLR